LTPYSGAPDYEFQINTSGQVRIINTVNIAYDIRTVVYLKSNINIEGEGTFSSPYEIK